MSWVPLHVHSQYSVLDSTVSIDLLVQKAKEYSCSALSLTDSGNMFGAVEFYKTAKAASLLPILGCELQVAPFSRHDKKKIAGYASGYPIVLLVKNKVGYQNLCKLSSIAHLEGFYYTPRIDRELLAQFSEGLICLTGPLEGTIATCIIDGKEEALQSEICMLQKMFGQDLYLEIQRHRMTLEQIENTQMKKEPWLYQRYQEYIDKQEKVIARVKDLSKTQGIPCVATLDMHYIQQEQWRAQEILKNVQSGEPCEIWEKDSLGNPKARVWNPKREVLPSRAFYFRSPQEMQELFSDIPEAITSTQTIADGCCFEFDFKAKYYPVFVPPYMEGTSYTEQERTVEAAKFLQQLCKEGVQKRYTPSVLQAVAHKYPGKDPLQVVQDRLSYELGIILSKEMGDYLLIVYDFIAWAKKQGIPMGPGRGSGAGSIILYLIGITDIEPLRFSLFFERFINPERISYPDIDVDICMDRRQEVIEYTVQKYGKDRVAQIITFGTMKAKMALKDVGRVLSVPLAKVNALAKLVPEDPNMTLEKALEMDPDLQAQYEKDPEVHNLITLALQLEGSVRNTGIHAAGLIIGGRPLMENIPLCAPKDSAMAVTQFSMKPVEAVGLLKIDFLGLKTLTSIQKAVDAVALSRGIHLAWADLPLEDKATFDLLNQGKTQGVFQVESGGMQELAKQLHIDKFEEIIAVGALYRPGPMEMIPSFIQRKHGKETIEIDHPWMADILQETYGIMVYQEQVMQIASRLAGYSLGEGDVLRRAMGKKDKEEMAKQREKFKLGALSKGVEEATAMRIFDKIEKFASYGFNKSHAAAYGYLTYVTAYLKANYPMEWFAALMTSDRDDVTKVAKVIREARTAGIAVLPPSINESSKEFVATSSGIRFAMSGIKGVGEGVVEHILAERLRGGAFTSLYDFVQRIDTKKVGKKTVEHLIEAGCFDDTKWSRPCLIASLERMFAIVTKQQKEKALGYMDFFSVVDDEEKHLFASPPVLEKEPSKQMLLQREYALLGVYLKEHPLDAYRHLSSQLSCCPMEHLSMLPNHAVCRVIGMIESVVTKISAKTQKKFAILLVSDGIETYEIPIWSELYEQNTFLLVETQLVYLVLQVEQEEEGMKLQCRWMGDLTNIDENMIQQCDVAYEKAKQQAQLMEMRGGRSKESKGEKSSKKEVVVKKNSIVQVKVDMDKVRLSHVLAWKQILRQNAGNAPLEWEFVSGGSIVGRMSIPEEWGVSSGEEWMHALQAMDGVMQVKVK